MKRASHGGCLAKLRLAPREFRLERGDAFGGAVRRRLAFARDAFAPDDPGPPRRSRGLLSPPPTSATVRRAPRGARRDANGARRRPRRPIQRPRDARRPPPRSKPRSPRTPPPPAVAASAFSRLVRSDANSVSSLATASRSSSARRAASARSRSAPAPRSRASSPARRRCSLSARATLASARAPREFAPSDSTRGSRPRRVRSRRVQFASKRRRLLLVRASRGGGVAFEVRGAIFRGGERGRESTRLRLGGVESFGERFRLPPRAPRRRRRVRRHPRVSRRRRAIPPRRRRRPRRTRARRRRPRAPPRVVPSPRRVPDAQRPRKIRVKAIRILRHRSLLALVLLRSSTRRVELRVRRGSLTLERAELLEHGRLLGEESFDARVGLRRFALRRAPRAAALASRCVTTEASVSRRARAPPSTSRRFRSRRTSLRARRRDLKRRDRPPWPPRLAMRSPPPRGARQGRLRLGARGVQRAGRVVAFAARLLRGVRGKGHLGAHSRRRRRRRSRSPRRAAHVAHQILARCVNSFTTPSCALKSYLVSFVASFNAIRVSYSGSMSDIVRVEVRVEVRWRSGWMRWRRASPSSAPWA